MAREENQYPSWGRAYVRRWCRDHGHWPNQELDEHGNCPFCLEMLADLLKVMCLAGPGPCPDGSHVRPEGPLEG